MGYLHKLRQSMHSSENRDHLKYQAKRVRLSKETLAQMSSRDPQPDLDNSKGILKIMLTFVATSMLNTKPQMLVVKL
ncbi:hypothetical protein BSL78_18201 [Apostichopus japonicus]|uniref:Uncharacterized protein n=1 Tax=Stichopus japonicus TaxID=307972 RepID=A0A2G8KAC0_STIJA|nr:hypothetical protein BSL78_18201 [Apostichopus japonicus]